MNATAIIYYAWYTYGAFFVTLYVLSRIVYFIYFRALGASKPWLAFIPTGVTYIKAVEYSDYKPVLYVLYVLVTAFTCWLPTPVGLLLILIFTVIVNRSYSIYMFDEHNEWLCCLIPGYILYAAIREVITYAGNAAG